MNFKYIVVMGLIAAPMLNSMENNITPTLADLMKKQDELLWFHKEICNWHPGDERPLWVIAGSFECYMIEKDLQEVAIQISQLAESKKNTPQ